MPPTVTKQDETRTATGADVRARSTADDAAEVATGDAASRVTPSVGSPHVGSAIVARDLSKTYPVPLARLKRLFRRKSDTPTEALRDVNLEIREGEIFGLIGRNGAGKTTFAKIIATLVQPTSGGVVIHGFDSVRDEERVRAQVGLASAEERSFYWRLTILQNLSFFARLYGMDDRRARARIRELIELFELGEQARQRFGQLSTGNKQRVILARAMLNDPPVLLLDEPTRSLDPLAAAAMRSTIRRLAAGTPPKTVLLTSHNLAEIEELCDRVAVISRGSIRALGTPQQLRVEHGSTELVRVTARAVSREAAASALRPLALAGFSARAGDRGEVVCEFTREVGDARLDAALGALRAAGGEVVAVEAERATLLDVLERYERGREAGDHTGDAVELPK
ncbi:MAG: ABC transporter ATP-binding protein [Acidobacteria bacterium]|nr:ABC transporter ATP-binding protein [Acidobacteriota bacterium]